MASRKDSSPAAYGDVKFILELAVKKPGLQYVLKSSGAAVNFKQRCNKYRNLIREMAAETVLNIPGHRAETAYDVLVIRQVGPDRLPDRHGCTILFEHQQLSGSIIDPETGDLIEIPGLTNILREY
jgi:hypothetical protein